MMGNIKKIIFLCFIAIFACGASFANPFDFLPWKNSDEKTDEKPSAKTTIVKVWNLVKMDLTDVVIKTNKGPHHSNINVQKDDCWTYEISRSNETITLIFTDSERKHFVCHITPDQEEIEIKLSIDDLCDENGNRAGALKIKGLQALRILN